ncbi:MAG: hypothetical protein LBC84_09085 [Prevotellaceae bacterium]|nr:hypothetical protein [Prevotellaceae bacterium]
MKLIFAFLSVCLFAVCCTKTPPSKLIISPNNIGLESVGTPITVELKSNVAWKVSSGVPDWLIVEPTSGVGDELIRIVGVPNTSRYPRSSNVIFVCTDRGSDLTASVRVSQPTVVFDLNVTNVLLDDVGNEVTVHLNSDAEWFIDDAPDWALVAPALGSGNSTIVLSAYSNNRKTERSGSITFRYFDSSTSLSITQKGNINNNLPPDKPELIFPLNNSIDISTFPLFEWSCSDPDGDSLSFTVCISRDGIDFEEYGPYYNTQVSLDVALDVSSLYYYKIKADDGDNGVTYSDTYCFTTYYMSVYADGEIVTYMKSNKPKPVVLVFTGDGYVKQDCNPGGLFEQNVIEGIEALFGVEPYKSYRDYFSVYIVFAHSFESGVTQVEKNIYRQTAFGSSFEGNDTNTHMSTNTDKAFAYALKVPEMAAYGIDNTCIFMIVNQDRYAGTCWMWTSGRSVAICPVSRRGGIYDFANIVLHEGGGHGFGRLADEYVNKNSRIPDSEIQQNRFNQNNGMYLNVDFIDDPKKILWSHFIGLQGYNRVDVFEGAAYYSLGAWRAEETNCMINNIEYYSAACRELIVKRILMIADERYDFEKFVGMDWVKTPGAVVELQTKSFDSQTFIPLATPKILPMP